MRAGRAPGAAAPAVAVGVAPPAGPPGGGGGGGRGGGGNFNRTLNFALQAVGFQGGGIGGGGGGAVFIGGGFAGLGAAGLGGAGAGGLGRPALDLIPFFHDFVARCPNLHTLELYGRRTTASILPLIFASQIENLVLSHPIDEEERATLIDDLVLAIQAGGSQLRELGLSGKAGEFSAVDRRRVLEACRDQGIKYASSSMR